MASPSPTIPSPTSDLHITRPHHFHIVSQPNITVLPPSSDKSSSRSTTTLKTAFSEKVNAFIPRKKGPSNLTEESLAEFNRRNAELDQEKSYTTFSPYYRGLTDFSLAIKGERVEVTATNTSPEKDIPNTIYLQVPTSSPYYKGLTDFTLALNRERVPPTSTSPGRESHAGSFGTTSSRTSFAVKMQELWGSSCFTFRSKEEKPPRIEKVVYTSAGFLTKEEPLRERGSESLLAPPPPLLIPSPSPPHLLPQKSPPPPTPAAEDVVSPEKRVVLSAKDACEAKEEKKYFWADKYRPENLEHFICNRNKAMELVPLATSEECCHFIFEGMPGVGKRTMIWALLRKAFGAEKIQARKECKQFNLKGEDVSSIAVNVKESDQHVEVNLSELKGYEKHVIVELIREKNKNLANQGQKCTHDDCRAIILYEADTLSTDALLYIRWILEKYKGCNKLFFCCHDAKKLEPIVPLCTVIKLLPPSDKEIVEVLELIARKEGIELPHKLAEKIAHGSKNNLRQAIRSFEATAKANPILTEDQVILTGWEEDIANIAKNIVKEQSPKKLYEIRQELQILIEHSVPPDFLFESLKEGIKKNVEEHMHTTVEEMYKEYNKPDHGFTRETNSKPIDPRRQVILHFMRIEEFIAKFMSCYKNCQAMHPKG